MRALVIEDDPLQQALLRDLLAEVGCTEVAGAGSADEARRIIGGGRAPDVILLDIGLPDGDGIDLCRQLSGDARLGDVPIIVVTGQTEEAVAEAVFAAGASDYCAKPLRPRELMARVRVALARRADGARRITRELGLSRQTRRLAQVKERLEREICIDPLTKIANRRHFAALFRAEWKRGARDALPLSVVFLDVDHFHAFNERYGHLGGDACLARVADAMASCLRRPSDLLARYGGEEFVALLPQTPAEGVRLVAERLRERVEALGIEHEASAASGVVTVSAGAATLVPRPDLAPESLLAAADEALYRAKAEGRNRVAGDSGVMAKGSTESVACASQDAPIAYVEPRLAPRVPAFLERKRAEAMTIRYLLGRGAMDRLLALGHDMKDIGAAYGFPAISRMGSQLEEAAQNGARNAIEQLADELRWYVEHVQVVYRRKTDPSEESNGRGASQ